MLSGLISVIIPFVLMTLFIFKNAVINISFSKKHITHDYVWKYASWTSIKVLLSNILIGLFMLLPWAIAIDLNIEFITYFIVAESFLLMNIDWLTVKIIKYKKKTLNNLWRVITTHQFLYVLIALIGAIIINAEYGYGSRYTVMFVKESNTCSNMMNSTVD